MSAACATLGCQKPIRNKARQLCAWCYELRRRAGTLPPLPTALERFQRHYRVLDNGCWEWTSPPNPGGYGSFRYGGRRTGAHRASYELHVGPIPPDHDIDHECHNQSDCAGGTTCPHRRCVNPEHLRPATRSVNLTNGRGGGWARRLETCPQGHRFDEANTYRDPRGNRGCRACRNDASKRYRARKASA